MRRHVTAILIGTACLVAPLTISAVGPEKGVAEMAAANQPATRTGSAIQTEPAPTAPTTTLPPAPPSSPQAIEILELVNAERTSRGLQPLRLEARLNQASQDHTLDQAARGTIFHVSPNGTDPGDRIAATGYAFSTWAENVAAGQRSAAQVMQAWMTSKGHCRNILNPAYTELGVGYVETSGSYRTWWTQKFARPSGVDRPAGTYDPSWC